MFKYEFILRSLSLLLGGFGARAQELSKNRISKSIQRVLQSTNTSTPMVLELLYTKTPFERLHADTHTHILKYTDTPLEHTVTERTRKKNHTKIHTKRIHITHSDISFRIERKTVYIKTEEFILFFLFLFGVCFKPQ